MKKKKQSPTPRYFTITIQYYPLRKELFVLIVLILLYFGVAPITDFINNKFVPVYFTKETALYIPNFLNNNGNKNMPIQHDLLIFHGARTQKEIALTFDADMTPGMKSELENGYVASYYNKNVIDVLNATKTKATLFLTGMWIEIYKQDARILAENPLFELGSHSYSHPSFDGYCYGLGEISDDEDNFQLQKTQALLKEITGFDNLYFRFPGGCYSQKDLEIVQANKLLSIQWDVAGDDGFNDDPVSIENNVLNNVQNGSIIVLHMHGGPNAPMTAEALPTIISTLKQRGFTFVKLSELLAEMTGSCRSFLPSDVLTSLRALDGSPSTRVTPYCFL